jgi:hypothetical protein
MNRGVVLGLTSLLWVWPTHAVVLWSITNQASATLIPPYQGQLSPFPKVMQKAVAEESDPAVLAAARRQQLVMTTKRLVEGPSALWLNSRQLRYKGVTNGPSGLRVLLGRRWVGLNENIPVTYTVNPEVLKALRELEAISSEDAQTYSGRLYERKRIYEKQGIKVISVNLRTMAVTVQSLLGRQILHLIP